MHIEVWPGTVAQRYEVADRVCVCVNNSDDCRIDTAVTTTASSTERPAHRSADSSQIRRTWAIAAVVVFGWGINFVFAKHALNQLDLATFNLLRFAGMSAIGWTIIAATGQIRPVEPRHRKPMVMVALVGFLGYVFGFSVGLNFTSAFSASLLLALVPLWVLAITAARQRRVPTAASLVAVGLAATGTIMFVTARTSVSFGWGDLVSVAVAAAYAIYLLMNRGLVDHYPPVTLTTYGISIAAVPVVAFTAWQAPNQDWSAVTTTGWLAIIWIVVVPVFVAWSVWNWVLQRLEPTQVAPLLFAVPVISGITSWILLDETIAPGQIVGTTLVIIGLLLNQLHQN
jgi:drug/metabolite transporter (DMT)-like permease